MQSFLFKRIVLLALGGFTLSFPVLAQDYVDLLKVNYANAFNSDFENTEEDTDVQLIDASLLFPVKLNDKIAIVTGIDYAQHKLSLNPRATSNTLTNLTFKAGLSIKHSNKFSGTYVLLPKISSEEVHVNGNDFFFGGLILFKYQKAERFQWRFGAYTSSEGFGVISTPIIGLHYVNQNKKLEITATLPIVADINYKIGEKTSFGFGFQAPVKSYSLKSNIPESYVQVSSIEFGPYFQKQVFSDSFLLRLQFGFSTTNYEVFEEGDRLPFRLSAVEFGDDRELLNPELSGALFLRIGFIYRFYLPQKASQ